jgi:hypothetical protein
MNMAYLSEKTRKRAEEALLGKWYRELVPTTLMLSESEEKV